MIRLDDICYAYDGKPVLAHVSFHLKKGSCTALLGPNGAGKSTLLRLLNGLVFPEIGSYHFDGTAITDGILNEAAFEKTFHQRIGFVWQSPDVQLFCSSVEEELAFGPRQMGLANEEVSQRVADALQLFHIEELRSRAPYTLSGGEKQRVALSSVLTMNPDAWTLDEPFSALDAEGQEDLLSFFEALKGAGKTLLIATHDAKSLAPLLDGTLTLGRDHTLVAEGDAIS